MRSLPPIQSVVWTGALALATVWPCTLARYAVAGVLISSACASVRSDAPCRTFSWWCLPVIFPLFLIHAVFNPAFPETARWGFLSWRQFGFVHAADTGGKLICLLAAAALWRHTDPARLVDTAVSLKAPWRLVAVLAQAMSILGQLHDRAVRVLTAQQARGLPSGPGITARLRALPGIILPVTLATLSEVDTRAACLASRGFGQGPMAVYGNPFPTRREILETGGALLLAVGIFALVAIHGR